eukprot:CAMPEP_0206149896 /NCGR_PEP_ID=MMETSP1473-20131121/38019_1 /ASSEMBLY_ACC=CAM_ASM_001109 /TAXON_ID=1461547 /ORGANISM="Stichococcus sp, Strain RCC1054" /LENGTH=347 /DNA_ID=CAMNT_0053547379 /DNA_START=134 /DNA_END=1179 /DNA_ORIENTATION=+
MTVEQQAQPGYDGDAVVVRSLSFSYPDSPPVVDGFSLSLPRGSRCLLCGANGAGKTSVLEVLAGRHLVGRDTVRILGRPAFYDLMLVTSGQLGYLGNQWRRNVACAGSDLALQGDLGAGEMIMGVDGVDPARRDLLIDLLDVDLSWRLNKVSDGQRRRVQICLGLLKPYEVLLLDEITVDIDVVGRLDLLEFFRRECEERGASIIYATHIFDGLAPWLTHVAYMEGGGASIIYATHIFDGLAPWITHVAYMEDGHLLKGGPVSSVPELGGDEKLLHTVERWLRAEREGRPARLAAKEEEAARKVAEAGSKPVKKDPFGGAAAIWLSTHSTCDTSQAVDGHALKLASW